MLPSSCRRSIVLFFLLALLAGSPRAVGQEIKKHPLTVEDLWKVKRVGAPSIAPDGKTVYCIGWTWPDTPDDASHRKKEKALKETKSKAVVIDDAVFRYWDRWLTDGKWPSVFAVNVGSGKHKNLLAGTAKHLPPHE